MSCIFRPRSSWGLEERLDGKTGKPTKLWIPRGYVIPSIMPDGSINRIRIRRPPEDLRDKNDPKYIAIEGGGNSLRSLNDRARAQMVLESDLDALLVDHLAGDVVGAIPLTTCGVRPDTVIFPVLSQAALILVSLDSDPISTDLTSQRVKGGGPIHSLWWKQHFQNSLRWPVPMGKDPGEAFKAGIDIRAWVLDALPISLHPAQRVCEKHSALVFDSDIAHGEIRAATRRISSACPAGAFDWLGVHRPVEIRRIKALCQEVEEAFAAADAVRFREALRTWEMVHLAAWQLVPGAERTPH
ncbi:hypothetical protein [Geomonas limicola]|nr:hypothetical protein [Geomonas limicola]